MTHDAAAQTHQELPPRLRAARALCSWLPPIGAQLIRQRIYPLADAQRDAVSFTRRAVTGSPFSGSTVDHVAYPFAVHGYFNWRNIAIAQAVCRPGDVICEVGANIGTETVAFSDVVGTEGVVYAIEPYPPNLRWLTLNAGRTRARNVEVMPLAVGAERTTVQFAAPDPDNSGRGYVLTASGEAATPPPSAEVVEVDCERLDDLRQDRLRPPRLLVIDAEGHEGAILAGAERILADDRPVVILEALEHLLARAGTTPAQLARQLTRCGYDLFDIQRFGLTPIDPTHAAGPGSGDWLALPSGEPTAIGAIRRHLRRAGMLPVIAPLNPLRRG